VIALLMLGLLVALGIAVMLGWTADSRDGAHTLWPLKGTRRYTPISVPSDDGLHDARRDVAPGTPPR
jgi:hypothetical protein